MKLLLHACCAPCSVMLIEKLKEEYAILLYFYNPNIHPEDEYYRRAEAFVQLAKMKNLEFIAPQKYLGIEEWQNRLNTLVFPTRCSDCYRPRLTKAAQVAKEYECEVFTSSLLYSKYQQQEIIITQGHEEALKQGILFLDRDFRFFWQEGIDKSKEYNLYRQKWCGCALSLDERMNQKKGKKK